MSNVRVTFGEESKCSEFLSARELRQSHGKLLVDRDGDFMFLKQGSTRELARYVRFTTSVGLIVSECPYKYIEGVRLAPPGTVITISNGGGE